jgi:hypothetical protein
MMQNNQLKLFERMDMHVYKSVEQLISICICYFYMKYIYIDQ